MEKYAVDLDKVLDDFEYNEEQAVRPNQYSRSELPAKKYQRPPFQRINIEDADFSPSKQTSSPLISYTTPREETDSAESVERSIKDEPHVDVALAEEALSVPDLLDNDTLMTVKLPDVTETVAIENGSIEPERMTCDLIAYYAEPVCTGLVAEESHSGISTVRIDEVPLLAEYLTDETPEEMPKDKITGINEVFQEVLPKEGSNFAELESCKLESNSTDCVPHNVNLRNVYQAETERDIVITASKSAVKCLNEMDVNGNEEPLVDEMTEELGRMDINETSDYVEEIGPSVNEKERTKPSVSHSNKDLEYQTVESTINDDETEMLNKEVVKSSVNEAIRSMKVTKEVNDLHGLSEIEASCVKESNLSRKWSVNETITVKVSNDSRRFSMTDAVSGKESHGNKTRLNNETVVSNTLNEKLSITRNITSSESESNTVRVSGENIDYEPPSDSVDLSVNEVSSASDDVVQEISKSEALSEPIQFVTEVDIPDEELEKYLEELEEEEGMSGKEVVEESLPVVEDRPQRPKSLPLGSGCMEGDVSGGTPGSTPCADVEGEGSEKEETASGAEQETSSGKEEEGSSSPNTNALSPSPPESPTCPLTLEERRLGKISPFWVPDADALNCMNCGLKFTMIKRRHHCRGCGRVLCGKCCDMRASLEYLGNQLHRVCEPCFRTLTKVMLYEVESESEYDVSPRPRGPNPNNPMEYCSTVPPPLQASPSTSEAPPSVLVPVLKRGGSAKNREAHQKKVMFSDGIRPGGDLTALDEPPTPRSRGASAKRVGTPPGSSGPPSFRNLPPSPPVDPTNQSFIINNGMPPVCEVAEGRTTYHEPWPFDRLMERLQATDEPPLLFAVNRHLKVSLKIVQLDCCMQKPCWVFSTRGMATVGQDEVMVLLQMLGEEDEPIPADVFFQLHCIYESVEKGDVIKELGYWSVKQSTFLDSRQHGGFLFVRPTFQCVQNIDKPGPPYLVAVLIHRLELPWARLFPLRLMLRLGAEFRYYPCSLVSVRNREPVYFEIGQTIINLLADFRNYSYTLPEVQGLRIHMEAQQTSVLLPKNRYDQVVAALNNSNEPVLPFTGTFSPVADSHLVCMQSKGDEVTYHTHAINIHDKPRKVTGTSFVVFNASLKSTAGVQAKSHMVEDGVMVQVSSDTMTLLRGKLRAMENWSVMCGPNNEEVIQVVWSEEDKDFNRGVRSVIDGLPMDGVPSIRVHNGTDYMCFPKFIRWTQVFIIKCEDGATSTKIGDPLELNRLAEAISRATCTALTKAKLLDHLAGAGVTTLALRATITQEQVCYEVGGNEQKLEPIYMNQLDNELIPVLHKASATNTDSSAILELVFHILDQ